MLIVVCIPARYDSTRFPGKVLAQDTGKYLIQHTYEQACNARLPQSVLIAADDERIVTAAETFGAACVLTRADHQSGTDRIAEAKRMVEALHEAGIGVVMDVVYNHTGTQATFELLAPGYFLR